MSGQSGITCNKRHALQIINRACVGCSHCMRVCPTEAIRVRGGKAEVHYDWCIDCGECYRVCPQRAIRVADDDLSGITAFRHRVLLLPTVFYAQFGGEITREQIDTFLTGMGFTQVCPVEQGVDVLASEMPDYVATHARPVISSYCPAIVRLIQVRFPVLVDHIMRMLPPLEVTAVYYQRMMEERGIPREDVGIFYATPCAAKIAAVKEPIGGYTSPISGVVNMDHLYNKVYHAYKNHALGQAMPQPANTAVSSRGLRWVVTGGEAKHAGVAKGRTLAIDGMDNVIEFLEKLENDKIEGIDYLELRACDESCSGGILARGNRFITVERLKKMAREAPEEHARSGEYLRLCSACVPMDAVEARSMIKYDPDIKVALQKVARVREVRDELPGIDCGACGAPSCEALAQDVVCRDVPLASCIFMETGLEKQGLFSPDERLRLMESIWGKERFGNKQK